MPRALARRHRDLYDDPSIGGDDPGSAFDGYLQDFADARLWVADRAGEVVGFTGLIIRGRRAEIEPVVVSSAARRQGVGRRLVEAAVATVHEEGVEQIRARPVARNAEAIGFFHELGFTALGHVELLADFARPAGYWRPGERLAGRDFDF
ncbi:MAG TPA: GNAT family N-acetyltransferase [Gaiellaceae bacterium]|nr:GNAT family N-acetyltransferase [Gaiellaceae bacterium]